MLLIFCYKFAGKYMSLNSFVESELNISVGLSLLCLQS